MNETNTPQEKEKDRFSGVETTGHEWDGLKELNNPTPRWWLWVLIITVIWSVGYWVVYPAWPTLTGATPGRWSWTQYGELKASQAEIVTRRGQKLEKLHGMPLQDIRKNPELYEFARAGGAALFKENCAACHGTGAEGRKGYPNLNDDDWLWGGTLDEIYQTIRVGVRSGHSDERVSQMPSFGRDGLLKPEEIRDVAKYVENLHLKESAPADDAAARGKAVFEGNCSACHGPGGEGNTALGAPRLNDAIWLYGGTWGEIESSVANAHAGVMPTWEGRLSDDALKELAVYVHALGGGK